MGARSVRFKVLLVEDEVLISEMVAEVLAEQGFDVHTVGSATEALCILKAGTSVDVLFTDINLGDGMDGVTLAMHARVMLPDLPVVFASGRWGTLEGLADLPRSAVLPKPYSPHRAGVVVAQLLAAPGPQSRERLFESSGFVLEHA
jgi:CheY-like chemotaxis protein